MSALERKNLEAHVDLCAERYDRMADKIEELDKRIVGIESMLVEIRSSLHIMNKRETDRWSQAKDVIIGVLATVCAYLLTAQFM
jgi:uncharacterized protein YdcH (DUF465 family)